MAFAIMFSVTLVVCTNTIAFLTHEPDPRDTQEKKITAGVADKRTHIRVFAARSIHTEQGDYCKGLYREL